MKIFFVRHGESMDEIFNELGGWHQRELSPEGYKLAFELPKTISKIQNEFGNFDVIYTSPLLRAQQTAQIIGSELKIRVEEYPYLKERNTYGILAGINVETLKSEYPELYREYKNATFIPGCERYQDFKQRIFKLAEVLKSDSNQNILCVTHGHVMTVFIEEVLGLIRDNIGNGSILGLELIDDEFKVIYTHKLTFTDKRKPEQEKRKFRY